MSDEFLARLSAALEARHDGSHPTPEVTRARVLEKLAQQRRRRVRWIYLGVPLLALGLGSSALAASGVPWSEALAWLSPLGPSSPVRNSSASHSSRPGPSDVAAGHQGSGDEVPALLGEGPANQRKTAPESSTVATETSAPAPSTPPSTASLPRPSPPSATASLRALSTARSRPSSAASVATDSGLELYRLAHDAHFKRRNFAAARRAYAEYLQRFPAGPLAPEARYNLALCETELGDEVAARQALDAFQRDAPPSYRDDEARSLREALDGP